MSSLNPRAVFGMPAYGRADTFARTLESLLGQTRPDFAVVIVDDRPLPETRKIVDAYAARDARVIYEGNPSRLGMIGNWRRAFGRARTLFPRSRYFAWVSDHDIWHPRWLEVLSATLDAQPEVVLAYPQMMRVYRTYRRRMNRGQDTAGEPRRHERLRIASARMTAGNAIYGLFRTSALARAGVFRPVLAPDRQLLTELALFGEFRQVPEVLWYREVAGEFSYGRQRRMFFPGIAPPHTYLPVNLQHTAVMFWDLVVRGAGRPDFGRTNGLRFSALQLWYAVERDVSRSKLMEMFRRMRPDRSGETAPPADQDEVTGAAR